jgi:hypothetical protein
MIKPATAERRRNNRRQVVRHTLTEFNDKASASSLETIFGSTVMFEYP